MAPPIRFATVQKDATWRVIDNGKAGSQNAAASAFERIHTTSNQASLSIALHFRRLLASALESLQELHQCTCGEHFVSCLSRTTGSDFASSRSGCRQLRRGSVVNCGACHSASKGAVLHFNRVSGALVANCRRWLGIPTLGFYDDFKHGELRASVPSAYQGFQSLLQWLGYEVDPSKSVPPST